MKTAIKQYKEKIEKNFHPFQITFITTAQMLDKIEIYRF